MRVRRRSGVSAAAAMAVGSVLLVGCGTPEPQACPAIGFVNTLDVEVTSSPYEVAAVHLCEDGHCVGIGATPPPLQTLLEFVARNDDTWSFETAMDTPDPVLLRFVDGAGRIRDEKSVDVEWREVDELDPCSSAFEARVAIDL